MGGAVLEPPAEKVHEKMNFDVIKRDEVRVMYEQAANKSMQVKILADLMSCEVADVCNLLGISYTKKRQYGKIIEEKALEMHRNGATTKEIAKAFGVTKDAVKAWKWRNGLVKQREKTRAKYEKFQSLYDQGMNDSQIAAETGVKRKTVCDWRKQNKLPALAYRRKDWDQCDEIYFPLYHKGMIDSEIAEVCGVNPWNVKTWRQRNGLKSNRGANCVSVGRKKKDWEESNRLYRPLYDQGLNDHQIARITFSDARTVFDWRHQFNLPVNGRKCK